MLDKVAAEEELEALAKAGGRGAALLAQAAYDAFWLKRLVASVKRYRLGASKAAMAA